MKVLLLQLLLLQFVLLVTKASQYEVVFETTDPQCADLVDDIQEILAKRVFERNSRRSLQNILPLCRNCYQDVLSSVWVRICLIYRCFGTDRRDLEGGQDDEKKMEKQLEKAMKDISKLDSECDTSAIQLKLVEQLAE